MDGSGNVYVTGWRWGGDADFDYATIKYAPNGDTLWIRLYNGVADDYDEPTDIAVDGDGNVYVTGESWVGGPALNDYATIKYAPNGDTLWVRRYDDAEDRATALAVDDSGNLYVTGRGEYDYVTIKYAPNGDTLWLRRYAELIYAYEYPNALAIGDNGNIYVTGFNRAWPIGENDYATVAYSSNGDSLWIKTYNGPADALDDAFALAVDDSGNVYVTGSSEGDYATIKYSPCTASSPLAGDADASGIHTLGDIIAEVNFAFNKPGFPACPSNSTLCWLSDRLCRGDWNGSNSVTLADVIQGVNHLFNKPGGPWNPVSSFGCCKYPL